MLEVGIIICLAISLFLALRNFPKTAQLVPSAEEPESFAIPQLISVQEEKKGFMTNILKNFFKNIHKEKAEEIREAINSEKEVISPSDINQAKQEYNQTDPEVARFLIESSNAFDQNDMRMAEELALEAISKDKKCGQAYAIMGKVAFHRGSLSDAKDAFKTALKCDADNAEAYYGLGMIKLRDENYTEAIDDLQKAVNIDRSTPEWYAELGKVYMEVRQFAKAAKALKRAASLDIDNKEYKDLASEAEDKQRAHASVYRKMR